MADDGSTRSSTLNPGRPARAVDADAVSSTVALPAPADGAPVRAVFFDAGGTLIHIDRRFLITQLAQQGIVIGEDAFLAADRAANAHAVALMKHGVASNDATRWRAYGERLLHALGCTPAAARAVGGAIRARHRAGLLWTRVEPGTAQTLAELRTRGFTLIVVSNADGRVADFLAHAGIADAFDAIIDSARVGVEKPDPRIFSIACARAGVAPHEAVHVGDILEIDVYGARAAGVEPVLLDPHGTCPHAGCRRITRLAELGTLLPARAAVADAADPAGSAHAAAARADPSVVAET